MGIIMGSLCSSLMSYRANPERPIDMVALGFERFHRYGYVIWPESQQVYRTIQQRLSPAASILVAGAGIGWGAALLGATTMTDVANRHVEFCRQLYPTLTAQQWDITAHPWPVRHQAVVAVEVLEHIADQASAVTNLIESTTDRVWLSTPNRRHPGLGLHAPLNPYHVRELLPQELIEMASGAMTIVRHWETGERLTAETAVSPLLYEIVRV